MGRLIKQTLKYFLYYILITGAAIFFINPNDPKDYLSSHDPQRFFSEETGPDRAVLIEDRPFSGVARIDLLQKAESTIDVAYYTQHSGAAADLFFANLLKAADRGVNVRIILDGMFHNLRGSMSELRHALAAHPKINLKFYEPFTVLKPWTWHNRLHDKMIIVDSELFMIGGRNIGDKYYLESYDREPVYDRDVLIINSEPEAYGKSVLSQADRYFSYLWNHEYSELVHPPDRGRRREAAERYREELIQWSKESMEAHPEHFGEPVEWKDLSVPARNIELINNPIERWNKRPWVWAEITRLLSLAEESVYMQSPYIIPTPPMRTHAREITSDAVTVLTNSKASTPNFFAFSGYANYRRLIAEQDLSLYEYHGEGSIHAKSFVIDSRLSLIGAFNIDPRSAYLSTETMVVIDSEPLAGQLEEKMKTTIGKSLEVMENLAYRDDPKVEQRPVGLGKTVLILVMRIITFPISFLL